MDGALFDASEGWTRDAGGLGEVVTACAQVADHVRAQAAMPGFVWTAELAGSWMMAADLDQRVVSLLEQLLDTTID
jgi:hypothetical protein